MQQRGEVLQALSKIFEALGFWDSSLINLFFTPFCSFKQFFTDGITNKLLGCYVGAVRQDVVLVRIYGNKTELLVDRENEVKSFRVLHEHRCAPRLYCTFNNGLCYEFLQGAALEPKHIRSEPVFR